MHKYCTYVVKLLLSHNIQYMRGTYLLSQNIPGVYFGICEKIPGTPDWHSGTHNLNIPQDKYVIIEVVLKNAYLNHNRFTY